MRPGAVAQRRSPQDRGNRRLIGAVLVSLLVHGVILSLQFGIPALGLPGSATPIEVRLADAAVDPAPTPTPTPTPAPAPSPDAALPVPPAPLAAPVTPAAPSGGMRLIDPVPAPAPVPTPVTPRLAVKKDKPRKAKRISPPLPATDALAMDTRVIVQDAVVNDFAVPMPRPEEAEQKTIDLKEAQHGTDDGTEASSAAEVAEAARAAQLAETRRQEEEAERLAAQRKREEDEEARKLAASQARQQQEQAAAAQEQEQQARVAQKAQVEADAARERASVLRAEQQKAEQLAAQQKVEQKIEQETAEQRKADQLRAEQQRAEQQKAERQIAEQMRAEQLRAEQLKADQQKADQLRAEQLKAERQRAEQLAAQQQAAQKLAEQQAAQKLAEQQAAQKLAEQQAAQKAAEQQAAQKLAEQQAARKKADQAAQDAEAARPAALQRGPDGSGSQAANTPAGGTAAGAGSGAGGKAVIPKNLLGSELSNRAREMVKGLDILSGTPPPPMRDERRVAVGAAERDLPLRMYVESWRQKIERNGGANYPRGWADVEHTHALVNVAVRSDGTVQDVTILRSSGRADMDDAVLRIVRVNARYSPFPPNIASRYDVIDIRRVWQFGDNLKLMEEVR
ncbi:cell envelope integrity protein TolA [Massilia atriviolacea]|uniref:Cell envelope integrity protein TolA n=1 Tax=Massilia atriviolacea TaxID=2495579 RepID=A0A430HQG8_9BURK|nr:cell envelope integrity protein TolA [Massilia atriviolacea]RSZ59771.1 cell envelope integrity protein TolA [Massilia atriviolacea]